MYQKYDAVVGDTTILANRSSYVDFTFPYTKSGVGLIVPVEDQVKRDSISFLKPLTWKLWMTSFSSSSLLALLFGLLNIELTRTFADQLSTKLVQSSGLPSLPWFLLQVNSLHLTQYISF